MTDALVLWKTVLEKESIWHGFNPCLIEDPVGFDLLVVGEYPAIPISVPGSLELPTASLGQNLDQAEQMLAREVHEPNLPRMRCTPQELVIRFGRLVSVLVSVKNWY